MKISKQEAISKLIKFSDENHITTYVSINGIGAADNCLQVIFYDTASCKEIDGWVFDLDNTTQEWFSYVMNHIKYLIENERRNDGGKIGNGD